MGKSQSFSTNRPPKFYFLLVSTCLLFFFSPISIKQAAYGIGFISHHTSNKLPSRWQSRGKHHNSRSLSSKSWSKHKHYLAKCCRKGRKKCGHTQAVSTKADANKTYSSIQDLVSNLETKQLMPGITYKRTVKSLRLNVLDIDTAQAPVIIKPIVSPQGATRLQTVKDHTSSSHALAAINANYFKNTGTPLGTLIIDGDWVAGPLYDRVALGISSNGFVRIDRVGLGGTLYTSNPELPKLWINNINSPRRSGCRTMAYSRKWGDHVSLAPYEGCLVSIDAQGRVLDSDKKQMTIPYGGIVLCDSEDSAISALRPGDQTYLRWQVTPESWTDITQAVSGGPMLIKDNAYCINLKAESFHNNWTSSNIKARTACGVTANNHLLLVTAEGTHTLYDLAHILHELGAVDAMNLDGGGSTTMVIHDSTVNMESKSNERRVAVALGIFLVNNKDVYKKSCSYIPQKGSLNIAATSQGSAFISSKAEEDIVQNIVNKALNLDPAITAEKPLENQTLAN